jgi:hypothetical protein
MQCVTAEAVEPSELRPGDEREEARKLHADQGVSGSCMISTRQVIRSKPARMSTMPAGRFVRRPRRWRSSTATGAGVPRCVNRSGRWPGAYNTEVVLADYLHAERGAAFRMLNRG